MNCMRVDPAPPERLVVHLCCTTCLVCFCHRRQQVKVVHCCCLSVVRGEPHQLLQTLLLALFLFLAAILSLAGSLLPFLRCVSCSSQCFWPFNPRSYVTCLFFM